MMGRDPQALQGDPSWAAAAEAPLLRVLRRRAGGGTRTGLRSDVDFPCERPMLRSQPDPAEADIVETREKTQGLTTMMRDDPLVLGSSRGLPEVPSERRTSPGPVFHTDQASSSPSATQGPRSQSSGASVLRRDKRGRRTKKKWTRGAASRVLIASACERSDGNVVKYRTIF